MGKKSVTLMPKTGKILEDMGEQIRLARMRRKITVALVAERAGVSRASVWAVEKGSAAVAIGIYAAVLHAINGLDKDLLKVAADDELGQFVASYDDSGRITAAFQETHSYYLCQYARYAGITDD